MITVTVYVIPGTRKDINLVEGSNTLGEALRLAEVRVGNNTLVQRNGFTVSNMDTRLAAGDRIQVSNQVKGN